MNLLTVHGFIKSLACVCPVCGGGFACAADAQLGLCALCRASLIPVPEPFCGTCGQPLFSESEICLECRGQTEQQGSIGFHQAVFLYGGGAAGVMHAFKSSGWSSMARFAAAMLGERIKKSFPPDALLCPVPSLPSSVRRRGFNHMVLVGQRFEPQLRSRFCVLLERRGGGIQKELGRAERMLNLENHIHPARGWEQCLKNKAQATNLPVVLVDDVRTTGASLQASARALIKMGFGPIHSISLFLD